MWRVTRREVGLGDWMGLRDYDAARLRGCEVALVRLGIIFFGCLRGD